jgi:hypothetical protein
MDTTALEHAYTRFLDAAADTAAAAAGGADASAPPGEWDAGRILGHVVLVDAGILAAGWAVAAGDPAAYDNRRSMDLSTIDQAIARAGGAAGLPERIRRQGEALAVLAGRVLGDAELDTPLPVRLVSGDQLHVDQPLPLRVLIAGLAEDHLPRHAAQLRSLTAPA